MFLDLIKLHSKNKSENKTPLEDFNTEAFANILKMYPEVCYGFCFDFLNLPEDVYVIQTQYIQPISTKEPNCIVDLVFIGNKNVCFIENKVESTEGENQLDRYITALKENHSTKNKHLHYCTKYADPKEVKENRVTFKQFRWYEVAKFLKAYNENPLIEDYLEFLNHYKMAQDNTLKTENLIAMENMNKTIEIVEFHIDNSKSFFIEKFGYNNLNINSNWHQIKKHNRFSYHVESVINSLKSRYSEILYGIDLVELKIFTQIYLNSDNESYSAFKKITLTNNFEFQEFENQGARIYLEHDLGKFLNNTEADKLIQDWYKNSFELIDSLINKENSIPWNIPV